MTFSPQESSHRPSPLSRTATTLVALLVWVILAGTPATGRAETHIHGRDHVLVLHSYGPDFAWTRSQQEGIEAVFGPLAAKHDLRIEYLDAIHNPGLLKGPLLLELLRVKLSKQKFQVVLTSDNAAFDFARAHRAVLFPGVPIVFMGLNGFDDAMLRGERDITGVAEDGDMFGTLQVLQQLAPQTRLIVFPGMADDLTYRGIRATVEKDLAALPKKIEAEFREYPHVEALLEDLQTLPPDAVIYTIGNMRTRDGLGISSERAAELMSSTASVPLYTSWDFLVGHGAVGGSVISGVEQGRLAAEMAVQVLNGEHPASIPVRRGAGKTIMFDHRQLVRFDIPVSQLPQGAVVRFLPPSTLSISQEAAWIAGVSFVLLLGVSVSLVVAVVQRHRSEEQVRALNQALEQRVAERTCELEQANKELESFAYSVSHDLRAPLRHIDGFLTLLEESLEPAIDDKSRHYMSTIAEAARRMSTLIDDLLAFSRMGRQEMSKTPVNLNGLVVDVIHELEPEAAGRDIDWHIADLPVVAGDRAMLRAVLFNLISNALKYTSKRPQARIEIGPQPGEDGSAVIFVRDNGAGFDMRFHDKLFGVFQRLHRIEEFEGTGIGLANVARIIARHGGKVWAQGQVDQGATFYVSFPSPARPVK
ncbi:MAG TPA: ABC transporter substrate binding protein [Hydrogenophaga sp.]|nr:ABC transporter substrate binding protein [Hydrogenophaga sp.]